MGVDWAGVYRREYDDLVRFVHRHVWDVERAHDIVQETFARALNQSPDNPRAWLFRVAGNLAKDEARTAIRRRKHLVLIKSEAAAEQDAATDMSEAYEKQEQVEAVRRALHRLTERDRDVLLLWTAGLSYEEIAEASGLAPGAVGTTLSRARRRLVDAHRELEERHAARG